MGGTTRGAALVAGGLLALLATGCGDDSGGSSAAATDQASTETTESAVEFESAFCEAFGDPVWVEFNTADQRTEEQAAQLEELSGQLEATAPDSLAEDVAAMNAGTEALVAAWRDAGFDPAAVDSGALTDLSVEAADPVHKIEGLAEDGCDIPRGQGGTFASG